MPHSWRPKSRPCNREIQSLNAVGKAHPNNYITAIAAQPEFRILTSLLWVRRSHQQYDHVHQIEELSESLTPGTNFTYAIPDESQPDLGLLRYHQDRLVATAEALQWRHIPILEKSEFGLSTLRASIAVYLRCLPNIPVDRIERRKLRMMVSRNGVITIDSTVIDCLLATECSLSEVFLPKSLSTGSTLVPRGFHKHQLCKVLVDTRPTQPSLFTTHKTTYRAVYNAARTRANIQAFPPTEKEVLLYNTHGEIMEASLSTPYFYRHGEWITPATICGGNLGVTRRLALEKEVCAQGTIELSELENGEHIWLSNGARGFFVGQICLERTQAASVFDSGASP